MEQLYELFNKEEIIQYYFIYTGFLAILYGIYLILVKKGKLTKDQKISQYFKYLPAILIIDILYRIISFNDTYIYILYVIWFIRYLIPNETKYSKIIRNIVAIVVLGLGIYNFVLAISQSNFNQKIEEYKQFIYANNFQINFNIYIFGIGILVVQRILFSLTWVYIIESIHGKVNRLRMFLVHAYTELPRYIPTLKYVNLLSRIFVLKKYNIAESNSLLSFMYERKYSLLAMLLLVLLFVRPEQLQVILSSSQTNNDIIDNTKYFIYFQYAFILVLFLIIVLYPKYLSNFTKKLSQKLFGETVDFHAQRKNFIWAFIMHFGLAIIYAVGYYVILKSLVPEIIPNVFLVSLIYVVSQLAGALGKGIGKALILPFRLALISYILKLSGYTDFTSAQYTQISALILAFQGISFYVSVIGYQLIAVIIGIIKRDESLSAIKDAFILKRRKNEVSNEKKLSKND
jgi:hypothetical protein